LKDALTLNRTGKINSTGRGLYVYQEGTINFLEVPKYHEITAFRNIEQAESLRIC
jgi:hypothetical protein